MKFLRRHLKPIGPSDDAVSAASDGGPHGFNRHGGALNLLTLSVQDGGPKDAVSAASQGIPSDPCAC